jgi:DNA polymerase III sliding clamp (beta) subunit (PCNA family)
LIHATAIGTWLDMLDSADDADEATVTIGESVAECSVGSVVHSTRLMAFQFPDYESAMPTYTKPVVKVSTAVLVSSLKGLLATYTDALKPAATLALHGNVLDLRIQGELSEATDSIAVEYDGPNATTQCNPTSLLEGLVHCGKVTVLNLEPSPQPITMRRDGDASWFYLSMPVVGK